MKATEFKEYIKGIKNKNFVIYNDVGHRVKDLIKLMFPESNNIPKGSCLYYFENEQNPEDWDTDNIAPPDRPIILRASDVFNEIDLIPITGVNPLDLPRNIHLGFGRITISGGLFENGGDLVPCISFYIMPKDSEIGSDTSGKEMYLLSRLFFHNIDGLEVMERVLKSVKDKLKENKKS